MDMGDRETRREETEKELDIRVGELTNLMKIFREKVDNLEKTVHSLEVKMVDYIQDLTKAKGEIDI
ncbi:uncharacterized protein NEPG_01287 [Nematocida parisii ERTm1]|uniref:Uncharacterized protein n=1 Tax=Nematocida parisii (strain ERTm3) TaxID=935791 RepID=I3EG71_NEMP3|nr:uncharacterized protein NEPG_01287 [Nematocida parisii ERTm1]EIJ88218.1 hypothetical protein NEQG_01662 [Nematocida parisii ERTm3]EIJ93715.1 hypothetical protein NEPG_01287 [Nematocida parisii ERTm1]|eukprot:XP_013059115.1 hypothetical protein NEPG_01287 [Nematocida parisii ERTm1]